MPLVRNCSCRGSSGFAHLSCIVRYAESDGRNSFQSTGNIGTAFQECPNCKQEYQNDVRYNLERARMSFVEREFKNDPMLHLCVLIHRVRVLDIENDSDFIEGDKICFKMLSIIDEMKSDPFWESSGFIQMEAVVLYVVGLFNMNVGSEESLQDALGYFGRAICLFTSLGDEINMLTAKMNMSKVEAKLNGIEISYDEGGSLKFSQKQYVYWLDQLGEHHPITIRRGELYAHALYRLNQGVAAERLLTKLSATSHRVHGPTHNCTLSVASALEDVKERRVFIDSRKQWFHALRYENDGLRCVVKGPVQVPDCAGGSSNSRSRHGEQHMYMSTLSLPITDVFPGPGTPVVCHGLVDGVHLNGKIGDTRGFDEGKFEVHFEEADLEPARIKHENLRILFELP
ncbi:hypothetical protein ACHAXM_011273 [Skeletonema potamos]